MTSWRKLPKEAVSTVAFDVSNTGKRLHREGKSTSKQGLEAIRWGKRPQNEYKRRPKRDSKGQKC